MRKGWKKYVLMPVLFLIISVAISVYVLLGTATGNQWLLRQVLPENSLTYGDWQGDILSGASIRQLAYQDGPIEVAADRVSLSLRFWSLLRMTVHVDSLQLEDGLITLQATENTETEGDENVGIDIPIDIRAPDVRIKNLAFAGVFERQIESIKLNAAVLDNVVQIEQLDYQDQQLSAEMDGEFDLQAADSSGFSYALQLQHQENSVRTEGHLSKQGHGLTLQGTADMQSADVAAIETLDYELKLSDQLQLSADVLASGWAKQQTDVIRFKQARIQATSDLEQFDVKLEAPIDIEEKIRGAATASWQGTLDSSKLVAQLQTETTDYFSLQSTLSLHDGIQAKGQLTGGHLNLQPWIQQPLLVQFAVLPFQLDQNNDQITVQLDALKSQLLIGSETVAVEGDVAVENNVVTVHSLLLQAAEGTLNVSGNINPEQMDLQVLGQNFDLALLSPEVSGIVQGEFALSGSLMQPHIKADAALTQLSFAELSIASVGLKGQGVFPEMEMTVDAQSPQYGDQKLQSLSLQLQPQTDGVRLNVQAQDPQGRALDMQYSGDIKLANGVQLQGQFDQFFVDLLDLGTWQLAEATQINADTALSELVLSSLCLRQNSAAGLCIQAQGSWATGAQSPLMANVEVDRLPLDWLSQLNPSPLSVDGVLSGDIEYSNGVVKGELGLQESHLIYATETTTERKSIEQASIELQLNETDINMVLDVAIEDIGTIKGLVQLVSYTDDAGTIEGQLTADLNSIDSLPAILPFIAEAKGGMQWDVAISGQLQQPQLNVTGALKDGFVLFAQNGMRLDQLNVNVKQANTQQLLFDLQAQQQTETLELSGQIDALWDEARTIKAELKATDFTFFNVPELKLKGNSQLQLSVLDARLDLTGDIELTEGHFTGYEVTPAIGVSEDAVVHGVSDEKPQPAVQTHLDIGIRIPSGLQIDALGLDALVLGQLNLKTSAQSQQLEAFGQLELTDGSYEIYGQNLTIERGLLDFNGPLANPGLSVSAVRVIDTNLSVGVRMGGTVNQPKSTLFSNPTLPETDILSYLITGRNLNEGSGDGENQLAQAATLLGVKSVLPKLQSALGVDLIRVDQSKGSKNTALEVEKNLSENLSIGYSYGLFNDVGFWLLKYQLSKALRLESAYGESQAVDLIYSIKRD